MTGRVVCVLLWPTLSRPVAVSSVFSCTSRRSRPAAADLPVPLSVDPTTGIPMASSAAGAGKSLFQGLRRFLKKPWEITGPCASPEYRSALPDALEYRVKCPATVRDDRDRAIVPSSDPETVYDIKYYTRDRRRNRPLVRRTLLRKPDVERYMAAKQFDPVKDFPQPYVNTTVEEDDNTIGGGYQK